jgi:phage gpG-like protein
MRIDISILGDDRISRDFLRVGSNAEDLSSGFRAALDLLEERAEAQFASKGGQTGGWAPLAESTLRSKRGTDILVETGALRGSLVGRGQGAIRDVRPDGADFGTDIPYAMFHHRGTSRMPKRPLIGMDEVTKRAIMRELQRALFAGEPSAVD